MACAEDVDDSSVIDAQLPKEVTSKLLLSTGIINDGSLEKDENGENENITNVKEDDLNDELRNIHGKLSSALCNVNAKEDLVKQHAKVAEEAIAGTTNAVTNKYIPYIPLLLSVISKKNH